MGVVVLFGAWLRTRCWTAVAALAGLGGLDLDDLRSRFGAGASTAGTARGVAGGASDEDAVAARAADVDHAVVDVEGPRLVAVDFDAGAEVEAEAEVEEGHCWRQGGELCSDVFEVEDLA